MPRTKEETSTAEEVRGEEETYDIKDLIREAVDDSVQRHVGDGQDGDPPTVVPEGQQGADRETGPPGGETITDERGYEVRVVRRRDVDDDGVWSATARLLTAIGERDDEGIRQEQNLLARAGHFGREVQETAMEMTRAVMVTGTEGTPFLPTTVLDRLEDIMKDYGAARRVCNVITGLTGSVKIPNVTGRFQANAVNESSIILGRKASFGSTTLDPQKWGVIAPWTSEMDEEVGAQVVQKIIALAGEAFARAEDETIFIADGTATYHSLTGLLNDATIGEHTLGSGNTSFSDIAYDDLIDMRTQVDPMARGPQSSYIFHHDFESEFDKLEDTNGSKIFGAGQGQQRIERVRGRSIEYTEAMPDLTDDAVSTSFGLFGDFSFVTFGFQRTLQATLLREATIQDTDDATLIHLAAQDALALRFTALWDVKYGLTGAFSKVTTPAS